MNIRNVEFKAETDNLEELESKLLMLNPEFTGTDHQIDTYFKTNEGRLKLRERDIENALINYHRPDTSDLKNSDIILYKHEPDQALKRILASQLGVEVVVDKVRKIYFVDNVKFHFARVDRLGTFIEVEATDENDDFSTDYLRSQCNKYFDYFGLQKQNLVGKSYCDLIKEINP